MAAAASGMVVTGGAAAGRRPRRRLRVRLEDWPLVWIWPVGLVFMQATFTRVADFDVTLAVILCHVLQLALVIRYWVRKPSTAQLLVYLGALAHALLLGLFSADPAEFLRSMAHVTNLILMVAICMNLRIEHRREVGRSIRVFCVLATLTALVVSAQSVAFNLFHDLSFTGLLGPYSPPIGLDRAAYVPAELASVKKANGWFSEPSVAAWFLVFAAGVALAARRLRPALAPSTAVICLTGAVATLTLTGLLASIAMVVAYVLFVPDSRRFKLLGAVTGAVGIGAALVLAGDLGVLQRIWHIDDPGTSVYFRLTAPFILVTDSLVHFPLGYPLGQTEFIEGRDYYTNWDGGSHSSIDNMLFAIVFHFGLLGVVFTVAYLLGLVKLLLRLRRSIGLVMLGVTLGLVATGAGWAHQGVLVIGYAIVVARYIRSRMRTFTPRTPRRPAPPPVVEKPLTRRRTAEPRPVGTPRAAPFRVAWQRSGGAP